MLQDSILVISHIFLKELLLMISLMISFLEESRLDILINNAGVMRCPRSLTSEGIEMQIGVKYIVII